MWAFAGVAIFSFSLPATKIALEGFSPWTISFGRAAVAGLIALCALAIARAPRPDRSLIRPLIVTALGAVLGWPILLGLALQRTTSAHAAVIAAVMPIATAVIAVVRTSERAAPAFWLAAGSGSIAVVTFSAIRGGFSGADLVADVLLLLAVISSAACYVEGAVLTRAMPGWQVISWVLVMSLPVTLSGTVVSWLLGGAAIPLATSPWIGMLYLSTMSMYVGFFAWYRGLHDAGVVRGSQMQLLQSPLTLVWSAWLLGEVVTPGMAIACGAIVVCVVWTQRVRLASTKIATPSR